ncbi:hypothetical protein TNCT_225561 [Trichonephila clavata]|uniref:RNA-directed DNA polymerase from mobile element jockey n=1 Tax=Trichonephila clavata TaxID=2740835 RepID=A0A8X6GCG9_TRICU|nr:hypothetical protein TNCT_225561 [Trichonephila clavata]
MARNRKPSQIPPLLGHYGLVYSIQNKANLIMETLEESNPRKKENLTPYNDDHIDLVDREVRRYFRNYRLLSPPLIILQEICKIILSLDNKKKTPGFDQVKNIVLKSLPINAITNLTNIFNNSFLLQYFSDAWKYATITILPSQGNIRSFQ